MPARIGTAAVVLVIGTAAGALAQREDCQQPQGEPDAILAPAEPRVELPPIPPLAPPADPVAVASEFLSRTKAEIERLEGEKRAAERELARAKARVRAAEVGIAKWRSLADTLANAVARLKDRTTDRERAAPPGPHPEGVPAHVETPSLPVESEAGKPSPDPSPTP